MKGGIDFFHLMTSGQFSDLKLTCRGKEFKIHKLVACSQSSVIATALKGDFKEAQSSVINIELFDAETVRRMVEYLYTGDYDQFKEASNVVAATSAATPSPPNTVQSQGSSAPANTAPANTAPANTAPATPALVVAKGTLHHVQVNAIADYYGIQGLGLLANQKIQQAYAVKWDPKSFIASAKAAISVSGDKSLHGVMALLTAQNLKELLKSGELASLVGEFAASVLHFHAHLLDAARQEQGQVEVQQQSDLQARCQSAEARATRIIENIGRLVSVLCEREYCRNGACQREFGSYIEVPFQ
ncbi:speckle-type POZ protein-like [Trichoderma asperellum]|uniref:Speckle-type POZ protein-like n=1 Tax=Trichoderma asperellum TaxID=101201 RepID=A0A6V8QQ32_TRIAP|nr:speckle-type POZ protein-like [Trichoderma asperellum]